MVRLRVLRAGEDAEEGAGEERGEEVEDVEWRVEVDVAVRSAGSEGCVQPAYAQNSRPDRVVDML